MRRLCLLVIALIIAFYGLHLIVTADDPATYVLRDGLLIALVGALLFSLNISTTPPPTQDEPLLRHLGGWPLLLVIVLAAALRLGWMTQETLDCIDSECEQAVRWNALLAATAPDQESPKNLATVSPLPTPRASSAPEASSPAPTLFTLLTRFFYSQTGDTLGSLRLSGALLGLLTLPLFFLAARQVTTAAGALVGVTLLALSPWHIWASRTANPWVIVPLLICLLIWGLLPALRSSPRVWWLLPIVALCVYEGLNLPWGLGATIGTQGDSLLELLTQLWHGTNQDLAVAFSQQPLLTTLTGALALLGWAAQVRNGRQERLLVLLVLSLIASLLVMRSDWSRTPLPSLALTLLPCAFIAAALAADHLLVAFQQVWQPVIRPALVAPLAVVGLIVLSGPSALEFTRGLGATYRSGSNDAVAEMSRLLVQRVQEQGQGATYFAPTAVLSSPVMRLLGGTALQNTQVQPLENTLNTLLAGAPTGNLLFLIPPSQQRLLPLLARFYPVHTQEPQTTPEKAEPLFTLFAVEAQAAAQQQGLSNSISTDSGVSSTLTTPPTLQFDWHEQATLDTPFTAQWQGTIRIPTTGLYGFGVDGVEPAAGFFVLHIDGMPVLNSTGNQFEQSLTLAKGFYRWEMSYRSNNAPNIAPPPPLTVRWQAPERGWEPIPAAMLHPSPLLNSGLLASYYGNEQWQEPLVDQRKDLLIGPPADLTPPYSVRWQGKVAAARAGEYLFGTVANGVSQVTVAGQGLINNQTPTDPAAAIGYTEGTIYLEQGWHDLEVRYAPGAGEPDFQLLWQPAGGAPGPLESTYLAPVLTVGTLPNLPPAPLADPTLGDDRFALALVSDLWQPQLRLPPQNLPLLPFVLRWQVRNGCGSGDNQLNQPHGVLINPAQGQIAVADTGNKRLLLLTLAGQPASVVQDGQFQEPVDVALDHTGRLLVLDALAQQIFTVDAATQNVGVWPISTGFYRPRGFTVDGQGNVSVADTGGGRVAALDSVGLPLGDFGGRDSLLGKGQPVDALSVPGGLWAISAEDGRLWRLNGSGSLTAIQRTDTINGPQLAGLADGSFFVSDPARGLIAYHAASGQPRGHFAARDSFTWPTGVGVAQQGDQLLLAVVDTPSCTLSVWEMPMAGLAP